MYYWQYDHNKVNWGDNKGEWTESYVPKCPLFGESTVIHDNMALIALSRIEVLENTHIIMLFTSQSL